MTLKRRLEGDFMFFIPKRLEEVHLFLENQKEKSLQNDDGQTCAFLNDFFGLGNLAKLSRNEKAESEVEQILEQKYRVYRWLKPSSLYNFETCPVSEKGNSSLQDFVGLDLNGRFDNIS